MLYLLFRGYGFEPSLWGVFLVHAAIWPRYFRSAYLKISGGEKTLRRLRQTNDQQVRLIGLSLALIGLLTLASYYGL